VGHRAKLEDAELQAIAGVVPAGIGPVAAPRADIARRIAWSLIVVLAIAVAGFAIFDKPQPVQTAAPAGIYGLQAASGDNACTEQKLNGHTGRWTCVTWTPNSAHLPVRMPLAYHGACTHLRADQQSGRWVCLSSGS
jgi:hypothetical protein